jgi:magnesium chelatase family protein
MKKYCAIDDSTKQFLKNAINRFNLSARAYDRILKISRTIADLEQKENIELSHIAQALQMRSF